MTYSDFVRSLRPLTISRPGGIRLDLLALGARITGLWVPNGSGGYVDVVLGHDRLEDYLIHAGHIGTTCGRYANRIAQARFRLDDREIRLDRNHGAHTLHGGSEGFDRKIWEVESQSSEQVNLTLVSPDGDMGFPGDLRVSCRYRLVSDHALMIEMTARTNATTVVNLANHAYFNLAGQGTGEVLDHQLRLYADHYTPVDSGLIPTGEIRSVADTPFDFRQPRVIRASMPGPEGLDNNFCLSAPTESRHGEALRPAAELLDPLSKRRLKVWTNEIGLQVYTGGHFDGSQPGKGGTRYGRFAGIALETQKFPDSPNRSKFPSARLDPGQLYRHLVVYDFSPD
ncbi:MAG TPA: aldose epimerase family protein [Tabrizicola sp.]|nr:aldose epimerase family protein [Tabrizicola sp.]